MYFRVQLAWAGKTGRCFYLMGVGLKATSGARHFLFALLTAMSTLAAVKHNVESGSVFVSLWLHSTPLLSLLCPVYTHPPPGGMWVWIANDSNRSKWRSFMTNLPCCQIESVFHKRYDQQTETRFSGRDEVQEEVSPSIRWIKLLFPSSNLDLILFNSSTLSLCPPVSRPPPSSFLSLICSCSLVWNWAENSW